MRTYFKVIAAADVPLTDPDLRNGGPVGRQSCHRLPHLRGVRLLGPEL